MKRCNSGGVVIGNYKSALYYKINYWKQTFICYNRSVMVKQMAVTKI